MPLSPADQGLLDAARYGTGKLLAVWLKRGANPGVTVPVDAASRTAGTAGFGVWHWLVDRAHDALLLDLRGRPDTPFPLGLQDALGNTAAHLAAAHRPEVWSSLLDPEVEQTRNLAGDTPLDVLRRHHPSHLPVWTEEAPPDLPLWTDQTPPDLPPALTTDVPAVAFPADWAAPPVPDPTIPGEAGLTPEAWQRRLWAPDLGSLALPEEGSADAAPVAPLHAERPAVASDPDPDPVPFVAPVIEWSTFSLDSQGNALAPAAASHAPVPDASEASPLPGEQVLDPVAIDDADAWVVDLEALLRPTSLLGRTMAAPPAPSPFRETAGRRPVPVPAPVSAQAVTPPPLGVDLRLMDQEAASRPLIPLDEHPKESVGHAFIADPAGWADGLIQQRTDGVLAPASLEMFRLPTELTPTQTPVNAWAVAAVELPVLGHDGSAPTPVRQGEPTAVPAWTLSSPASGPSDLAAAVAAQMARLADEPVKAPAWGLLPMGGAPRTNLSDADGWADAPVELAPKEPPAWALVD